MSACENSRAGEEFLRQLEIETARFSETGGSDYQDFLARLEIEAGRDRKENDSENDFFGNLVDITRKLARNRPSFAAQPQSSATAPTHHAIAELKSINWRIK